LAISAFLMLDPILPRQIRRFAQNGCSSSPTY